MIDGSTSGGDVSSYIGMFCGVLESHYWSVDNGQVTGVLMVGVSIATLLQANLCMK
jgi:hypothetical protein